MQSAAFVVAPPDGAGGALVQLGMEVGFETVAFYAGPQQVLAQSRRTPVCFFLVSSSVPKSQISDFVTEIRLHSDTNLKYAPMLYLSEDPSARTISFCMQSGFDDIVAPPFTAARLTERLKAQLGSTKVYCRTDTYFGPDRRRLERPGDPVNERRGAGGSFDIMDVRRDLRAGINVRKRRVGPVTPPPQAGSASPSSEMMLLD